uniref:Uncharacterized protein n=1 Tax=Geobacter metallireducens TaxID=28232 RepID=A0A831XFF7_GEOME
MPTLLTPATIPAALEGLGLFTKIADAFRPEEQLKIEWTSPDYEKISILWGLFKRERGQRMTFEIKGKPGFCAAVVRELSSTGNIQIIGQPRSSALRRAIEAR